MTIRRLLLCLVLAGLPVTGVAQMKSQDMDKTGVPSKSAAATNQAIGVVKSIDAVKNTVTLAHEPVQSLKWPAMTMAFGVKDKALFDKLQPGKKVEFEFVQQGKDYIITAVK